MFGLGAITGDVVGSVYEFDNIKTKDFPLFLRESRYTDDTVLTIAVMDWMLHSDHSKEEGVKYLKKWARKYPFAGFGGLFFEWMLSKDTQPYNSCGNGSAMRISAVPYLCKTVEEVEKMSDIITGVTHNHPEGLKGARVTAVCIFMSLHGASKEEIKEYVSKYYDLNFDYEELKKFYYHGAEICQITVPQAIYCFLISNSFEDCLRTIMSIGGDCDTTGAIGCAIAEAFYGDISEDIQKETLNRLPKDMKNILIEFNEKVSNLN